MNTGIETCTVQVKNDLQNSIHIFKKNFRIRPHCYPQLLALPSAVNSNNQEALL